MCGIVGYVGPREAPPILVSGLRKLEYRGYDSAGLATITDHHIEVRRSVGKLDNLDAMLRAQPLHGTPGVGHTRWATHGRPSEQNAHPHRAGKVVVIHNGIIENFLELRHALAARGRAMASETDTEVISHLIDESTTLHTASTGVPRSRPASTAARVSAVSPDCETTRSSVFGSRMGSR